MLFIICSTFAVDSHAKQKSARQKCANSLHFIILIFNTTSSIIFISKFLTLIHSINKYHCIAIAWLQQQYFMLGFSFSEIAKNMLAILDILCGSQFSTRQSWIKAQFFEILQSLCSAKLLFFLSLQKKSNFYYKKMFEIMKMLFFKQQKYSNCCCCQSTKSTSQRGAKERLSKCVRKLISHISSFFSENEWLIFGMRSINDSLMALGTSYKILELECSIVWRLFHIHHLAHSHSPAYLMLFSRFYCRCEDYTTVPVPVSYCVTFSLFFYMPE